MSSDTFAPGAVVVVRDEEWLVTQTEETADGAALGVQGLSDLVRGTNATFFPSIDSVTALDPREATVRSDDSASYRRARLWLAATLRKTAVPLSDPSLTVSTQMLARPLSYQHAAVTKALDPESLRPRILIADAVGLGKTLEIGMILAELIRRGRGERVLIVCPRHVLEQMQHEMWSRFAIGFVRLDSQGVARVKQKLPANRNPFTYFRRVIISVDTLKQERFAHDLKRHHWDAVVIDESHNITNSATQNNRLANILAPQTDALILASATPHNGRKESFAELVRLLDPTAVSADGDINTDRLPGLVIRRHRHSPEVAHEVGSEWAERLPPDHRLVDASGPENAVADELVATWLHPASGVTPGSGAGSALFGWTLAKAFLSSPAALRDTITERLRRIHDGATGSVEREALLRLRALNDECCETSAKYAALLDYLKDIGVGRRSATRVVVFSERVATLRWLAAKLRADLRLTDDAVDILHGGLPDDQQQSIVDGFKKSNSPIRVLVTGDVASEGVNLHKQCHHLLHYDIPWSLIRIEQRNGRIDRFGQQYPPEITTLLLNPNQDRFSGDLAVLTRLVEREHEAHVALGDAASLMGHYDVKAEEDQIRQVLAGKKAFDDAVADPDDVGEQTEDWLAVMLAGFDDTAEDTTGPAVAVPDGLYVEPVDFLRDVLHEYYRTPEEKPTGRDQGGVNWREHPGHHMVEFTPPPDLRQRLEVLPQSYLAERKVLEKLQLVTDQVRATEILAEALIDDSDSSWPASHFLGPLHPVLDWAADRALAHLARNEVFAVRGDVDSPTVLLVGTLVNRRGHVVASSWLAAEFPMARPFVTAHASAAEMLAGVGLDHHHSNPGAVDASGLQHLIRPAVEAAEAQLESHVSVAAADARRRVDAWAERANDWRNDADALVQRSTIHNRRALVEAEERLTHDMAPDRRLVRPLLVVVPNGTPVKELTHG